MKKIVCIVLCSSLITNAAVAFNKENAAVGVIIAAPAMAGTYLFNHIAKGEKLDSQDLAVAAATVAITTLGFGIISEENFSLAGNAGALGALVFSILSFAGTYISNK